MLKKTALAFAGLLALASAPAMAASCSGTGCYTMQDGNKTLQSVKAVTLPDGTVIQQTVPSDATGAPYSGSNPPPLQSGAAIAAKQPALGTAGTPASDVLSMQGVPGGTPMPADTVVRGTPGDCSGTVTTGGTAQKMIVANVARRGFRIQNQSTGDLFINELATATATVATGNGSLKVPAGAAWESPPNFVSTGDVSLYGATTGQAFYCRAF